ncbi:MAG: GTP-binding protein [Candidatus Hodarchaeales archaeon]|jgi:small GTP-binding protein
MSLYVFKVIIIGPGAVGKTSFLHRFVENKFSFRYKLTIGADFLSKIIEGYPNPDTTCKLQIWDIGGQDRYKFLRSSFFDGANGALVVFDISRWHTFKELDDWLSDLREFAGKNIPFILIGNKADLIEDIGGEYDKVSAEDLAKRENSVFISASAKTGENVEGAFLNLTHQMLKNVDTK